MRNQLLEGRAHFALVDSAAMPSDLRLAQLALSSAQPGFVLLGLLFPLSEGDLLASTSYLFL